MGKDVIVACDFDSAEKVFAFLDKFEGLARKPFVNRRRHRHGRGQLHGRRG